jgi:hypothetical protein
MINTEAKLDRKIIPKIAIEYHAYGDVRTSLSPIFSNLTLVIATLRVAPDHKCLEPFQRFSLGRDKDILKVYSPAPRNELRKLCHLED